MRRLSVLGGRRGPRMGSRRGKGNGKGVPVLSGRVAGVQPTVALAGGSPRGKTLVLDVREDVEPEVEVGGPILATAKGSP